MVPSIQLSCFLFCSVLCSHLLYFSQTFSKHSSLYCFILSMIHRKTWRIASRVERGIWNKGWPEKCKPWVFCKFTDIWLSYFVEEPMSCSCKIWGQAHIALCDQLDVTQTLWCIKIHPLALTTQPHHMLVTLPWMSEYQSSVCQKWCKNCSSARSVSEQSKNFKNCKSQLAKPERCGSPHANQDWILRTGMRSFQELRHYTHF